METLTVKPIGVVRSCFTKKLGIPRQPGIIREVRASIEIFPPCNTEQVVRGLEGFSHIWVLFLFHGSMGEGWNTTVRPPRLGGKKRVGVFASRSPFRPNPIGMSAVELDGIETRKGKLTLHIKGADLMDGTPVIDIKPYLPYSDAIPSARGGYAEEAPQPRLDVVFDEEAEKICTEEEEGGREGLRELIVKILSADPRPAYYRARHDDASFAVTLWDIDINWKVEGEKVLITDIVKLVSGPSGYDPVCKKEGET